MKKLLGVSIILLFFGMSIISSSGIQMDKNIIIPSSRDNILYVGGSGPNNYSSIQAAIDAASDGDTVFLYDDSSPYKEILEIGKTINLIGEDRDTTIIEGKKTFFTLVLGGADNIVISGFTITNVLYPSYSGDGITIWSNNNLIHIVVEVYCYFNQSEGR